MDKVDTRTPRQILSKKLKGENLKKIKKNDFRTGNALISESGKRKIFKINSSLEKSLKSPKAPKKAMKKGGRA